MPQLQLTPLNKTTVLVVTPMPSHQINVTLDMLLQRKAIMDRQTIELAQKNADNDALIAQFRDMGVMTAKEFSDAQATTAESAQSVDLIP